MDIVKQADMGQTLTVEERDLALINRWSRKALTAEEVYAFAVRLCDNEIDRDGERFTEETLEELARLFEGKSGIFDHQWSAKGQAARIYRTEVVREEHILTGAGDRYCYLKGYAYMVRTEENKGLIAEIEGGIKREVSVGCAVERAVCSICGEDIRDRTKCAHVKGREYGGKLCWADLSGATDAYEWSFVAVPAQPRAGVIKRMGGGQEDDLMEYLKGQPVLLSRVKQLEEEAALGRKYLERLRGEVMRLGGICEKGVEEHIRRSIADKLSGEELEALRDSYQKRLEDRFPLTVQLPRHTEQAEMDQRDGAFLI